MKKVLLGTSAIALAGAFAAPASATEWTVRVGGYMEQYAAYQKPNVDLVTGNDFFSTGLFAPVPGPDGVFDSLTRHPRPDLSGVDSKQDAEIHFLPSITLDNGLLIGAVIELEGNTSGDQIDESYMRIKGSFGEFNLGSENSAGYKMMYAAPDVTFVGVNSGSMSNWIPFSGPGAGADIFRGTLGSSFIETLRNNDIHRFTYYTPRFAGFQVGVSYARDNTQDSNAALDCNTNACDFFDVGANYVNSFGAFNVALAGRYGIVDTPGGGGSPEVWAAGANLGFGGFTVGGSYAYSDKDHGVQHGRFWDAGISYETGPWGFSVTHSRGKNVDNDCTALARAAARNTANGFDAGAPIDPAIDFGGTCLGGLNDKEELRQYLAGISYALAKGVALNVFGGYVEFEGAEIEDIFAGEGEKFRTDMDGWVVGTGIKISF
ncbi:MAG TPA: porin [Thermohalobaculum sp.]|nr:porin [Thermohalobaculum sp.]